MVVLLGGCRFPPIITRIGERGKGGSFGGSDDPAADDGVAVVEDGRLAGSDGGDGLGEVDAGPAAGKRRDRRRDGPAARADLDPDLDRRGELVEGPPDAVADRRRAPERLALRTDDEPVRRGVDLDDVEGDGAATPSPLRWPMV
ncbi:MAG: hypothetical protein M0C28_20435 [Candidatus Moduliflexus flocculans]|nr:hypothetical protein [Candidatus Moduliflexus flocculans]